MTETRRSQTSVPRSGGSRLDSVLAPRVTRVASYVIMGGVLVQAAIAGGFLAGHAWNDLHMFVGTPLMVSALVVLVVGMFGRRIRREPTSVLVTRLGVFLALAMTPILGIVAAQGTRDLLMIHIPLAIIGMGLAARLAGATHEEGRTTGAT
jgi:hypothetical protein